MAHVLSVSDTTRDANSWAAALFETVVNSIQTSPVPIGLYLCRVGMRKLLARLDRRATPPPDEWPDWLRLWALVTFLSSVKALHYSAPHFPRWLCLALLFSSLEPGVFVLEGPRPIHDPLYGIAEVRWRMLHCAITSPLFALCIVYFCPDAPKSAFEWLVLWAYACQSVGWLYFFLEMWPDLRDSIFPAHQQTEDKLGNESGPVP